MQLCLTVLKCNLPDREILQFSKFLTNVNSRSRSLYAIAGPSVCHLSVCL